VLADIPFSPVLTKVLSPVLGFGTDDATVDWVSYNFIPIDPPGYDILEYLVGRLVMEWRKTVEKLVHDPEARDLMERLMCTDPLRRLGANGASEVKCHPFFTEIDWNTIATIESLGH
jgi:serine/threonine-protein kinase RIM15